MHSKIRNIIREEIEKLFEAFQFANDDETFIPTTPISTASAIAMQVYENIKRSGWKTPGSLDENGNEGSGRKKSEDLSQRKPQSFGEMKRLKAFFDNNQKKVDEERMRLGITPEQRGTKDKRKVEKSRRCWQ
jgi:hypothetical protein